jgi:hypothetical protein
MPLMWESLTPRLRAIARINAISFGPQLVSLRNTARAALRNRSCPVLDRSVASDPRRARIGHDPKGDRGEARGQEQEAELGRVADDAERAGGPERHRLRVAWRHREARAEIGDRRRP